MFIPPGKTILKASKLPGAWPLLKALTVVRITLELEALSQLSKNKCEPEWLPDLGKGNHTYSRHFKSYGILSQSLQIPQQNLTCPVSHQYNPYHNLRGILQKISCLPVHSIMWRCFWAIAQTCCYITILSINWRGPSLWQYTSLFVLNKSLYLYTVHKPFLSAFHLSFIPYKEKDRTDKIKNVGLITGSQEQNMPEITNSLIQISTLSFGTQILTQGVKK